MESKREKFRQRIATTLEILKIREETRERYGQKDNPDFDEANYDTPYSLSNAFVYCTSPSSPLNIFDIENMRKAGKSLDDMMIELYDSSAQLIPKSDVTDTFRPCKCEHVDVKKFNDNVYNAFPSATSCKECKHTYTFEHQTLRNVMRTLPYVTIPMSYAVVGYAISMAPSVTLPVVLCAASACGVYFTFRSSDVSFGGKPATRLQAFSAGFLSSLLLPLWAPIVLHIKTMKLFTPQNIPSNPKDD